MAESAANHRALTQKKAKNIIYKIYRALYRERHRHIHIHTKISLKHTLHMRAHTHTHLIITIYIQKTLTLKKMPRRKPSQNTTKFICVGHLLLDLGLTLSVVYTPSRTLLERTSSPLQAMVSEVTSGLVIGVCVHLPC